MAPAHALRWGPADRAERLLAEGDPELPGGCPCGQPRAPLRPALGSAHPLVRPAAAGSAHSPIGTGTPDRVCWSQPFHRRGVHEGDPMTQDLKAVIVGGGIGGLTTAVALQAAGVDVTLLERAGHPGEV